MRDADRGRYDARSSTPAPASKPAVTDLPCGFGTLTAFDDAYDAVTHTLAVGIGSTSRSRRWPPTASSPPWPADWGACAGYRPLPRSPSPWRSVTGIASIGSYLGLVPSEHSCGGSRSQGGVTKTGNSYARRLLIESAWHHKAKYVPGKTMRERWSPGTSGGSCPR